MKLVYEAADYKSEYSMTAETMKIASVLRLCLMLNRLCTSIGFTSVQNYER